VLAIKTLVTTEIKFQVVIFGVPMLCSVAAGYQRFGEPFCLHLQCEVIGMDLWNFGTLPHHCTVSQLRRPRLETWLP